MKENGFDLPILCKKEELNNEQSLVEVLEQDLAEGLIKQIPLECQGMTSIAAISENRAHEVGIAIYTSFK